MPPTLYLVATPIGNLEDITLRALRVLREVALIAAEDTRRTARLLTHYGIHTPTTSFYEQVEREKVPGLIARLTAGESLAVVSDAGTPGVSDPGYRLVRAAVDAGIRVEAVPGASAVLAALATSAFPTSPFSFIGFPPARAHARNEWLRHLGDRTETLVFFEAPHRIRETLESARGILGDRPIAVARELTKVHEEVIRGPISDVLSRLRVARGEFTIVLTGADPTVRSIEAVPDPAVLLHEFGRLTDTPGCTRRTAISRLAQRYGLASRAVYALLERAKAEAGG